MTRFSLGWLPFKVCISVLSKSVIFVLRGVLVPSNLVRSFSFVLGVLRFFRPQFGANRGVAAIVSP